MLPVPDAQKYWMGGSAMTNPLDCWPAEILIRVVYGTKLKLLVKEMVDSTDRVTALSEADQQAHCVAALISYVKLEKLKLKTRVNYFALKKQLWVEATRQTRQSMSKLSTTPDKYAHLTA